MLVDDEEWCLEELAQILNATGLAEVTGEYSNPLDALSAATSDAPDVIFMDVQMPGLTGLELAQKIRRAMPSVYLILLSEKECFARNGFDIGVDDYLLKPLRRDRVLQALLRVARPGG
jgi:YesN/AraC family two-component response regulator